MIAGILFGLAAIGAGDRSAVYVGRPDEPRYRGQVQRIEVYVTSPRDGTSRVALRFHHPEGSFALVTEGPSAQSLLTARRKLDITRTASSAAPRKRWNGSSMRAGSSTW